ncbi:MAG TPA: hypothetical protein VL332_08800 [Candidatus Saccharimonadaceae bacterium]|nr:hypothetical protein [Candidatus Saccharimonadaceae bacterium]
MLVAVALRAWRIRLGLPDFLEEAIPLRVALGMTDPATGHVDWNPHFFNYPSLSIYLHFVVQKVAYLAGVATRTYANPADYRLAFDMNPTPMVVAARGFSIAVDGLMVLGVFRIAERLRAGSGWIAGLLVAFAPTLIVTGHSIFADTPMTALAVWAIERLLAWSAGTRARVTSDRGLLVAGALIGLAAGAKYPAAGLILPYGWLALRRDPRRGLSHWIALLAAPGLFFLATTPFAVLDPHAFWRDLSSEGGHAAEGHLGSVGRIAFPFFANRALWNFGIVGLALAGAALVLPFVRRARARAADHETPGSGDDSIAVWLAVLVFAVPISLSHIEAERYIVPVLAMLAPLVAAAALQLGTLAGPRLRLAVSALVGVLLLVPVARSGLAEARRGADDTQLEARRWCEAHVPRGDLLVQEGYAARLPSAALIARAEEEPAFRYASPSMQARIRALPSFHVVTLPLAVSGYVRTLVRTASGQEILLDVFPFASDLDQVFYEPRLVIQRGWFMTSDAVRARYESDTLRYPVQHAFYRRLDALAPEVKRFAPHGDVAGPIIVIRHVSDEARDALGPLDPVWWRHAVPADYRARFAAATGVADTAASDTAFWVRGLRPMFERQIGPFVRTLSEQMAATGHVADALPLARALLAVDPSDGEAAVIAALGEMAGGRYDAAYAALQSVGGDTTQDLATRLLYAEVVASRGDTPRAVTLYTELMRSSTNAAVTAEAERRRAKLLRDVIHPRSWRAPARHRAR